MGMTKMKAMDTSAPAILHLRDEELRAVERLAAELRAGLGPRLRDIRIFGSSVTGLRLEESDVDVLVLIRDLDEKTRVEAVELAHAIAPYLSLLVEDFDRYHAPPSRASGIYREIREHSIRL